MRVGVPAERKEAERRVALTPSGSRELVERGHEVIVEAEAGAGAGHPDDSYRAAGASIAEGAQAVWGESEVVLKVKEPVQEEYGLLRAGLTLFTFLHLAADRPLTEALLGARTTGVAYETVVGSHGGLPLLLPMSEIAGRLAALAAAHHLLAPHGGPGLLISGSPGVRPARVLILGGGAVGRQAAKIAAGVGAQVTLLELEPTRLRELEIAAHSIRAQVGSSAAARASP